MEDGSKDIKVHSRGIKSKAALKLFLPFTFRFGLTQTDIQSMMWYLLFLERMKESESIKGK